MPNNKANNTPIIDWETHFRIMGEKNDADWKKKMKALSESYPELFPILEAPIQFDFSDGMEDIGNDRGIMDNLVTPGYVTLFRAIKQIALASKMGIKPLPKA